MDDLKGKTWDDDLGEWEFIEIELTDEAERVEEIADKLVDRFVWLDREEVLEVLTDEDDEPTGRH